jgi:REP element-mobilizing transposase RayT
MARKPRIHRPGAFYHLMLRGNNGQPIFFGEEDRCRLCLLMQEGIHRFGHRIHGFCFMNNHIHIVLQVGENTISRSIHHLSFRYTRYINRKEKRVGHLFQGRFKAILIDDRDYLLELIRYVHLNPVRAGIVKNPESYRWCSHRAYLGLEELSWITQESILSKFDSHENTSRTCYEQFIKKGLDENLNDTILKTGSHEGRLLGTDDFVQRVLEECHQGLMNQPLYSLQQLIDIVCSILNKPVSVIQLAGKKREGAQARALIAYFVKVSPHLTLKEFASFVSRDISALSKLAVTIETKSKSDHQLAEMIAMINNCLQNRIAKSQA